MAGRRHHYLPRFLQRAFRYDSRKGLDYVHAHEGNHSYSPSTMGVGQERDFYGNPEESPADANITATETRLAEILAALNLAPETVSQTDQAQLTAALTARTKSMREAMAGLVKTMAGGMAHLFQTPHLIRKKAQAHFNDTKEMERLMDEQLRKQPKLNRETRARFKKMFAQQFVAHRPALIDEAERATRAVVPHILARMDEDSAAVADGAFRRIFEEDPTLPKRVASLTSSYRFSTIDAPEGEEFILGDCAAVALRTDGVARLPLGDLDDAAPLEFIFLPVSPTRCLVAARGNQPVTASVSEINRMSAALSHRFFISHSEEVSGLTELRGLIGSGQPLASEEDFAELMKRITSELEAE